MIGVIGNSNAGKSSLVNAILGQKILPQNFKCCTSVVTNVSMIDIDEPRLSWDGYEAQGAGNISKAIKAMNSEAREADDARVQDVSVFCKPEPKSDFPRDTGLTYDGMLKLVDMPGVDETDNDVVKQCLDQLLSMCHGLWIVTKFDSVKSDGLATLLRRVESLAPHLLEQKGAITFVITQADLIRNDGDSDDEDCDPVHDLKEELRGFLRKRFPKCALFIEETRILATSVDENLRGGHDFWKLFDVMANLHALRKELITHSKVARSDAIGREIQQLLDVSNTQWPDSAARAIASRDEDQTFWTRVAIVSTVVTLPLGGAAAWLRCGICLAGSAIGALVTYAGARGAYNANGSTLGGERVVGGADVGAEGACRAVERLREENVQVVANDAEAGKCYKDMAMLNEKVLYVGEFRKKLPHGVGRLFWPDTQYEAFIGKFEDGKPVQGTFLNERGFFVGHMKATGGGWTISGYQADDPSEDTGVCIICCDRPSMQVEQRFFLPCSHGNTCIPCAMQIMEYKNECPTCKQPITSIGRF